jgi:ATP-binding protein involved in chromosome partitioning
MATGQGNDGAKGLARVKHSYVVLSGKGGVGKSTVAVGLAVAAASSGRRTGLLDSDLHGPSASKMLGLGSHRCSVTDTGALEPASLLDGNLKVMSMQFLLSESDTAVIWRGPLKHKMISQLLQETAWEELDCLIADSPPGTGDEPLSVVQTARPDGAVVVTTPQEVSSFDVRKSLAFCRSLELPVVGIVENMAGFTCPECGKTTDIYGRGGGKRLSEEAGVPLLGSIPIDPRLVAAGDAGEMGDLEQLGLPVWPQFGEILTCMLGETSVNA